MSDGKRRSDPSDRYECSACAVMPIDEDCSVCCGWEAHVREQVQETLREVRDALENAAPDDGSLLNAREVVFSAWLDKQIEVKE